MQPPHRPARVRTRTIVALSISVSIALTALSLWVLDATVPAPGAFGVAFTLGGWTFVAVAGTVLAVLLWRQDESRRLEAAASAIRERRFHLLADHVQDVVSLYQVRPTRRFDYVSPAVEAVLGYPPERFYADPEFMAGLVHPDDRRLLTPGPDEPQLPPVILLRIRHADGRWIWMEQRSTPVTDELGRLTAVEGVARDVTERQAAATSLERLNRVLRTLSAANQALVRAETEQALVEQTCRIVVDEGGYRFAWVGYRRDDSGGTIERVAHAGHEAGFLAEVDASWQVTDERAGPGAWSVREGRMYVSRDLAADPSGAPWRVAAIARGYRAVAAFPLRDATRVIGTLVIAAAEPDAFAPDEVAILEELADDLAFGVAALRHRSAATSADRERRRLAAIAEQSPESIVITDTEGTIEYVNPAFERITGYSRAEVLGGNPRVLKSGVQSPAFYQAMWATLTAGRSWVADIVNRRKDGSLFEEEAVISPVRDEEGRTTGYVAIKRDVTRERAAEVEATRFARERALIAETIGRIGTAGTPESTAQSICEQVVSLTGLGMAGIFLFMLDGRAAPLAIVTADRRSTPLRRVPLRRSRYLRDRAEAGPWVEALTRRPWDFYSHILMEGGASEVAFAPLVYGDGLRGVLVASQLSSPGVGLTEQLPALVEFARMAAVTLGPAVAERTEVARVRGQLTALIAARAFHPVFQPIVDIRHGRVVAYEALTRFDDGTQPDSRFAEAAQVGLGLELEAATLRATVDAARGLPHRVWLQVNVSPALVLAGEPLRTIVTTAGRRLVLEVTEHVPIGDYVAFRSAIAALGPRVGLAVDDAGAGFASLRHILELAPAFVKLDRSVIDGVDTDPARQAMVAGLRHFAQETGCHLIAEGVETESELRVLSEQGVRLAQGYLLGRPERLAGTSM